MDEDWIGRAVSIKCDDKLGVFQGMIKDISVEHITIIRAFRNGVPLRKQDAEITLRAQDILDIKLIPSFNGQSTVTPTVINKPTPVKQPNFASAPTSAAASFDANNSNNINNSFNNGPLVNGVGGGSSRESHSALTNKISNMEISNGYRKTPTSERFPKAPTVSSSNMNGITSLNTSFTSSLPNGSTANNRTPPTTNSVAQFFGNLIPPKVEVRMVGASFAATTTPESFGSISKPIDIINANRSASVNTNPSNSLNGNVAGNGNANGNGNGNGNGGKLNRGNLNKQRKKCRHEGSLKQNQTFETSVDDPIMNEDFDFEGNLALFDKQALWDVLEQKPVARKKGKGKYRHDENILEGAPLQLRQIETMFDGSSDFVTDEGLIVPTIPSYVRLKIEQSAEACGLSVQRQNDILARGTTDLAILLLGGARRLTPNNCHQWPTIAIICDKSKNFRVSDIGAATGRQLASHGLKVLLYVQEDPSIEKNSTEVLLFKATGNTIVYSVDALPTPDLVILSTCSDNVSSNVSKWLKENRASILAIDPPPNGIRDIPIKYSILPTLPLNGISTNCGKLYLCNLGIPDKFYRDAGIKYKSPFGHKFVIPIHMKD